MQLIKPFVSLYRQCETLFYLWTIQVRVIKSLL